MRQVIFPIIESVINLSLIFNVLNISIKKQLQKFILGIFLVYIIKTFTLYIWSEPSYTIKVLVCIPMQLTAVYLILRKQFGYIFYCTALEYIIMVMCNFIILFMLGATAEEMHKYENAAKICSYMQLLILLLIIVNHKQQEVINDKDFYIKNTENTLLNLRRQKHNFDNVLNTISGLINLKQYNKLKEFIKGTQTETNELQKCKNLCLSALITQKLSKFNDNVKVYIKIRSSLDKINLSDNELCECVGILLDNAYEAAVLTEDPYIGIEIYDIMENTVIKIRNKCREIINKKMLFKKGYSTKGKNRGIGLYIVNKIMGEHGNDLDVTIDKDEVVFSLIIQPECKASQSPYMLNNSIPAVCYSRIHEKV